MIERTQTSLKILAAAAGMGLFGNLMLRETPWGLNAFLFVAAFVGGLFVLTKRFRPELLTYNRTALLGAMVFFGSMFLFRDSIELRVYDTLAILVIMGVLLLGPLGINARVAGAFHYACGFIWSGINSACAPFVLLGADIDWKQMPGTGLSRQIFSVLRGVAIALPLTLIFGGLFTAADARFEALVNRVINFDLDVVLSHVFITAGLAWLSAGYFRASIFTPGFASSRTEETGDAESQPNPEKEEVNPTGSIFDLASAESTVDTVSLPNNATVLEHINRSDPPNADVEQISPIARKRDLQNFDSSSVPPVFTLGVTETVIILGLIDALFLTFVVLQVPYLFGGMDLVQHTPDFKLADYARRGFGELVAVSALVLPMLLLAHWLLRREAGKRVENLFRVLAGFQIALLFVIMASAAQRLILLTGESGYGLTTVRFYPMVFMVWLAVVFVWFALTVFRGRRNNFAWGALWSAILVLGATNLMNPDAYIAGTNTSLMQQGRDYDPYYNGDQLSSDAIPTVISALPAMSLSDQCETRRVLNNRYRTLVEALDLRSFNVSRAAALSLLRENSAKLQSLEGCPEGFSRHLSMQGD